MPSSGWSRCRVACVQQLTKLVDIAGGGWVGELSRRDDIYYMSKLWTLNQGLWEAEQHNFATKVRKLTHKASEQQSFWFLESITTWTLSFVEGTPSPIYRRPKPTLNAAADAGARGRGHSYQSGLHDKQVLWILLVTLDIAGREIRPSRRFLRRNLGET